MSNMVGMSPALQDALGQALGLDPACVRRVVIDIKANKPVVVHIERFGDKRVIDVVRELAGVEVRRIDGEQDDK